MNADQLLDSWALLPTPDAFGLLEANETAMDSGIWIAVDHLGARHLLVRIPDSVDLPSSSTKGMNVVVARHRITGQPDADYIDLSCTDDAAADTFATVSAELIEDLADAAPAERGGAVTETLARWRWFWGVTPERLSEQSALGLFAELWFLDQWVGISPLTVDAWTGSDNARHDFQWPDRSVEVKATARRADGAVMHTIQDLDQLADPETGVLYLFSLRVVHDRLAGNTLPTLVDRCSQQLRGTAGAREAFLRKVSVRGYSPAHGRLHATPYRILEEHIYEVADHFPRLTRDSLELPGGVGAVSYTLDMAACREWLIATDPRSSDNPFRVEAGA